LLQRYDVCISSCYFLVIFTALKDVPTLSLLIQIKRSLRSLISRWIKKPQVDPYFSTHELKKTKAILIVFVESTTKLKAVLQDLPHTNGSLESAKVVIFSNKPLKDVHSSDDVLYMSQDDFTLGGRLSQRVVQFIKHRHVNLLMGLNDSDNKWFRQLIQQLPAHFKTGLSCHTEVMGYHLVLNVNPVPNKISDNFEELLRHLKNLKIYH
jgi:hypothetical protein